MLTGMLFALTRAQQTPHLKSDGLSGYISASVQRPPKEYGYGVSLYAAAWPLLEKPVAGFQIGLASTWILPDNRDFKTPLVPHGTVARDSMPERGPSYWTVFQTIEGGLGYWTSNRYLAPTAKFRMNGSVDGYNHEVSTPGWDFYGKPLPGDQMGIAQLSPRVLVPPDGVTLAKDTCGELLGYAWMALPLVAGHAEPVATGDQCWTLFFNARNFRGPVAFYVPAVWSRMSERYPPAVGRGLDALPGVADSGAMEVNTVPQLVSRSDDGVNFSRIPQLQFPADRHGETVLMHNVTAYSKSALWDQVAAWAKGGPAPSGSFDPKGAFVASIKANPLTVKQGKEQVSGLEDYVATAGLDEHTFGLRWKPGALSAWRGGVQRALFPAIFRRDGGTATVVTDRRLGRGSGLLSASFPKPDETQSYVPSDGGEGVWKTPGPASGPFKAKLSDGSVVTYYWYRFVDQPSLQHAGLSVVDKRRLQALVEQIHRHWTPEQTYIPAPTRGHLAFLDPGLLVTPPKGLGVGYVPVAFRQDPDTSR